MKESFLPNKSFLANNSALDNVNLNRFKVRELTSTSKILIDMSCLKHFKVDEEDLVNLIMKAENASDTKSEIMFAKKHPPGVQTTEIYEAKLGNRVLAIKFYKQIINHLLLHTIASNYLADYQELNKLLSELGFPGKIYFPKTLAIKISGSNKKAILVQEWIKNANEIYKKFPTQHIQIIREITKVINQKKLMVDIMPKNWLVCGQNNLYYIDLILFTPKGKILEQIKKLSGLLS